MARFWFSILASVVLALNATNCKKDDGGDSDSSGTEDGTDDNVGNDDNSDGTTDGPMDDGGNTDGDPGPAPSTLAISGDLGSLGEGKSVVALPILDGAPSSEAALGAPIANGSDGPFTLQIDSGMSLMENNVSTSHVLLVTDNTKPRLDQADDLEFIVMPVGEDSLVGIPTDDAKGDTLDLGTMVDTDDGLQSNTKAESKVFNLEDKILQETARIDDTLRAAKNAYINSDPQTKITTDATVNFSWKGKLADSMTGPNPVPPIHAFTPFDKSTHDPVFYGYRLNIRTTHPAFAFSKFCQGDAFPKAGILPPTSEIASGDHCADPSATEIDQRWPCLISEHGDPSQAGVGFQHAYNYTGDTFHGPVEVFTSDNSCLYEYPLGDVDDTKFGFGVSHSPGDNGDMVHELSFGGPFVFKGEVPPGYWRLTVEDETVAKFDVAVSSPYRTLQDEAATYSWPVVYIPTYSLNRDENDLVISITIALHLYDFDSADSSQSKFTRVKDHSTVKRVMKDLQVGVSSNDGGTDVASRTQVWINVEWDKATIDDGYITVSHPDLQKFTIPKKGDPVDPAKKLVWSSGVNYKMFGSSFSFSHGCEYETSDIECAN